MICDMFEKYLQNLGLTEKEASVYVTLLQVDSDSVLELSKKTKINRTTVYLVLEGLMKKGLVGEVQIGKKTHYQAEPPERLETYVERKKVELEEHSRRLQDVIPQLKSIRRESGERPVVKYFEGREGVISVNDEFFRETGGESEKTIYLIYSRDLIEDIFSKEERERYRKIRVDNNIRSKSVYTYKDGDYPSDKTGDRLKIDADKYPITCDISVFEDKIIIGILGERVSGIFIRSKDLANTLKSMVNYIHDTQK